MSRNVPPTSSLGAGSPWLTASGVVAHPDSPVGGGGPGRSRSCGVLGCNNDGAELKPDPLSPCVRHQTALLDGHLAVLADRRKQSTASQPSPVKAPVKTVTLNLYGLFPNPWASKPNVEKLRSESKPSLWHPSSDDFIAILGGTKAAIQVESFSTFLGIIQRQPANSIARINLFSHGNDGLIAFSGRIVEVVAGGKTDVRVLLNRAPSGLDENLLTSVEPVPGADGKLVDSLGQTARKLRNRFAKGAEICFFLCSSGSLRSPILQQIADAFQVTARGFPDEVMSGIEFYRTLNSPIERGFTYFASDGWEKRKRGFKHLESALVSRSPRPDSGEN